MNTQTNNTNRIKIMNLEQIANFSVPVTAPKNVKANIAENYLDNRYELIGFVDRTNDAVVRERFYNVRDNNGRFARVQSAS